MRIGILGSGKIGGTLAKLWLDAGHEVCFGSRDPGAASGKPGLDPRGRVEPLSGAAGWAEALLLAVPLHAVPAVGSDVGLATRGKLLLDAGNAIPGRDGPAGDEAQRIGTGPFVGRSFPGAHIVKAFNTVYYQTLASEAHRPDPKVGIPLVGDDEASLQLAERLVREAGFDPVRIGRLADSKRIDFGSPVWNTGMTVAEIVRSLGVDRPARG
jgi:predicted dinucleotide-binding enzyme